MSSTAVVILNWNGAEHLARFMPSVIENTPEDVRIIVADNGSTDGSMALLADRFPCVETILLERNWGYAEGYNKALERVVADNYILLNSDVAPQQGWCEKLIDRLDGDSMLAAVAPKLLSYADSRRFEYAGAGGGYIDFLGYPFCRGRILATIENDEGQYDDFREVFWASGACMAVKAEAFRRVGGFDARFFAHMEEIDFCWRAQKMGYRIAVEPQSVVYHLGGGTLPNNTAGKLYLNFRNNLAMLYKNLPLGRRRWIIPLRMCLDGGSALVYLIQGRMDFFKSVWRAHRDFRSWREYLDSQRNDNVTQCQPVGIYHGAVVLRYLLGKHAFGKMM